MRGAARSDAPRNTDGGRVSPPSGEDEAARKLLVRARGVTKTFGTGPLATPVLKGIDLEIATGELALLMGPSGSGKTTLISVLAGLLRATSGTVELCSQKISELPEDAIARVRRESLGFVFQSYNLFPALSALDNVAEVLVMKGAPRVIARERASRALEAVGLGERLTYLPSSLSGGQKQRVAVARALAGEPALVLGDEVTAALDRESAEAVLGILRRRVGPGSSVLLVTHDRRLERYADRVIEMEDGRIVRDERRVPDFVAPPHSPAANAGFGRVA
ncbi:ABC transporter ATP-binding protein [bacterium]|nr:ABC transporter ATP-binding protein [bacterium]